MTHCIAIVEHLPTVRTALRAMLRPTDHEVVVFPSEQEFFEFLTHKRPDLVILDLNMPGRSALDIVSRLRAERIIIPTIVVTRGSDHELERRALQLGVRRVLTMPLLDELVAVIETALEPKIH